MAGARAVVGRRACRRPPALAWAAPSPAAPWLFRRALSSSPQAGAGAEGAEGGGSGHRRSRPRPRPQRPPQGSAVEGGGASPSANPAASAQGTTGAQAGGGRDAASAGSSAGGSHRPGPSHQGSGAGGTPGGHQPGPSAAGDRARPGSGRARTGAEGDPGQGREQGGATSGQRSRGQGPTGPGADGGGGGAGVGGGVDWDRVLTDLRRPAAWYPAARGLRRRVVAHLGPTNSGKTHAALAALRAAPSGVYCGPLRLLACEVADRLASDGLPCNLVTGQEVRLAGAGAGAGEGAGGTGGRGRHAPGPDPGPDAPAASRHTACTIEMAEVHTALPVPGSSLDQDVSASASGSGSRCGTPDLAVAVIDEIQMLADPHRGWAWTRALLGLAAAEVHVAGDPAALPLVRALVAECGDELEVVRYRRLSPLVVQAAPLGWLGAAAGGDCLVGFSRRSLHALRREVVRRTGREACLVYGALPPEARRQQAALFNGPRQAPGASGGGSTSSGSGSGEAGAGGAGAGAPPHQKGHDDPALGRRHPHAHPHPHPHPHAEHPHSPPRPDGSEGSGTNPPSPSLPASRVLCASDAIGMGLNLNIRRVVFTCLHKYDGRSVRPLQASEVRQIAGRAGRFSSAHPAGLVTTLHAADLPALRRALREAPRRLERAALLPSSEALAAYASRHPGRPLATSLLMFAAAARLGPSYTYGTFEPQYRIASALRHLGGRMSVEECLLFSTAPADLDDPLVAAALLRLAEAYAGAGAVGVGEVEGGAGPPPEEPPRTEAELRYLEGLHRAYDLYVWLAYRLPHAFPGRAEAEARRAACGALIEAGLEALAGAGAAGEGAFGRRHQGEPRAHRGAGRGRGWEKEEEEEEEEEEREGQGRQRGGWRGAEEEDEEEGERGHRRRHRRRR